MIRRGKCLGETLQVNGRRARYIISEVLHRASSNGVLTSMTLAYTVHILELRRELLAHSFTSTVLQTPD